MLIMKHTIHWPQTNKDNHWKLKESPTDRPPPSLGGNFTNRNEFLRVQSCYKSSLCVRRYRLLSVHAVSGGLELQRA